MELQITHSTVYRFDTPPLFGLQQLRIRPKDHGGQRFSSWEVEVENGRIELGYTDEHNNHVDLVSFDSDAHSLTLRARGTVQTEDLAGISGPHRGPAPLWLYHHETPLTKAGPEVKALVKSLPSSLSELERMHTLSAAILSATPYEIGASHPEWDAETVLKHGKGVCQDHSHVFLAAARYLGYAARYVSGYLCLNDRTAQDAMHAWAEVWLPDIGWVGFDVSNGISPDPRYVRVATGLDYTEAAPVRGSRVGGIGETLEVAIEIAQQ